MSLSFLESNNEIISTRQEIDDRVKENSDVKMEM